MRPARASAVVLLGLAVLLLASGARSTPALAQAQCFAETGFCIDQAAFQQYYESRGGARILGFPVSRTFRLEGFPVQFYQRVVLQMQNGNVARLNLLDPGVLPVTRANQSQFPAPDASLASDAPRPDDPAYAQRVVEYVRAVAPDTWNGLPVGFAALFNSTVPAQGAAPELATLLNLEIWGQPTSPPTFDPGNQGFVYQRFQRGIMHFRTECGCTEGILVGDYLKAVLTGRDVPPDLAAEMQSSRYFGQYAPGASGWLARPGELPDTDLTAAFEPGSAIPVVTAPTATPQPTTPVPVPTVAPISTGVIEGTVRSAPAGVRVALLDLPVETATDSSGAYRLPDLPPGEHLVYAVDQQGRVSDTYRVDVPAGTLTLNMDLQEFKPGETALFLGRVVGPNGSPVSNATVWRVGALGRTTSAAEGRFQLVDTFANATSKPPDKVTFVAAAGDRWGVQTVDFSGGARQSVEVRLTRTGRAPPAPRAVWDFAGNSSVMHGFNANEADFFTARWSDTGGDRIGVEAVDASGSVLPASQVVVRSAACMGMCEGFNGTAIAARLPRGQAYTLRTTAQTGADRTRPGWTEAQAVARP